VNTSDNQARKRSPRHRHWARRSHRVVAIGAFSFLILLAITGLLLNHSDDLGLPQQFVSGSVAEKLYGIEAPSIDAAFAAADLVFVTMAGTLYGNVIAVADDVGEIRGAVVSDNLVVVATDREFILTTTEPTLVERSDIGSVQRLNRIGLAGSQVVVELNSGRFAFDSNQMLLSALNPAIADIAWSEAIQAEEQQARQLGNAAAGEIISWERVLSDLHSGRILPNVGRIIFDLAALCLLYLCMSGVLLWFRRH